MTDQMQIDKPDRVTVGYDESLGTLTVVIQKRDSSTDEDLTYTFSANAGPVKYLVERHGVREGTTRM